MRYGLRRSSGLPLSKQRRKWNEPNVRIAIVPTLHALEVFLRLVMGSRKVNRDHSIAAEIERAMVAPEMRLIIGAEAVRLLIVANVPDLFDLSPIISYPSHDEKMVFCISLQPSGAAENQEGPVGCNLRINIKVFAITERKRLCCFIAAVAVFGRIQTLATIVTDVREIDGSVRSNTRLPNGSADINLVGQTNRLTPAGFYPFYAPQLRNRALLCPAETLKNDVRAVGRHRGRGIRPLSRKWSKPGLRPLAVDFLRFKNDRPMTCAAFEEERVAVG